MTPILLNAGEALDAQARLRPSAIGAEDLEKSLTYREWRSRSRRLARGLRDIGLQTGDRVAVLAYNRIEWAEIYVAAAYAGVVAVPINFRLTAKEAAYILQDSGAKALIVEDALADVAHEMRDQHGVSAAIIRVGGAPAAGELDYEALIDGAPGDDEAVTVDPDDPWCLMYTSGTTGAPKGAIRSHRGMSMLALMTSMEF